MRRLTVIVASLFLGFSAVAQGEGEGAAAPASALEIKPASEVALGEYLWLARPIIVFADSPADPRFREQISLLEAGADALTDRDVVVIIDTDPSAMSPLRTQLRPRGFMMVMIGKDGTIRLRKPFPWDVREISRSIDKTPLRQQEVRDRRQSR